MFPFTPDANAPWKQIKLHPLAEGGFAKLHPKAGKNVKNGCGGDTFCILSFYALQYALVHSPERHFDLRCKPLVEVQSAGIATSKLMAATLHS